MRSICLCFLPVVTMAASDDCWLFPPTRYNQKIQSSWSWTHKCNEVVSVCICCHYCRNSKAVITYSYYRRRSIEHFLESGMLRLRRHAALMSWVQMFFLILSKDRNHTLIFALRFSCLAELTYLPHFFNWGLFWFSFFQKKQKVIFLSVFLLTSMCDDAHGTCGVCLSHRCT